MHWQGAGPAFVVGSPSFSSPLPRHRSASIPYLPCRCIDFAVRKRFANLAAIDALPECGRLMPVSVPASQAPPARSLPGETGHFRHASRVAGRPERPAATRLHRPGAGRQCGGRLRFRPARAACGDICTAQTRDGAAARQRPRLPRRRPPSPPSGRAVSSRRTAPGAAGCRCRRLRPARGEGLPRPRRPRSRR